MSETKSLAVQTAIALLKEIQEYRKDDTQGITVIYAKGDESITLTVTQKPGAGGRWGGGGGAASEQEHTIDEIEAIIKRNNIKPADYKVWVEGDKVKIKAPYNEALGRELNDAGCLWSKEEKLRVCKLRGAPAPSPFGSLG